MSDVLEAAVTATIETPPRIRAWTPVHSDGYQCDRLEFDLDYGEHQRRQAAGWPWPFAC